MVLKKPGPLTELRRLPWYKEEAEIPSLPIAQAADGAPRDFRHALFTTLHALCTSRLLYFIYGVMVPYVCGCRLAEQSSGKQAPDLRSLRKMLRAQRATCAAAGAQH